MTLPTAAPWMVTINHSFRTYQIWDEDGNYHDSDIPEREANRSLIAACPALLAAARRCVAALAANGAPNCEAAKEARAAIAQAEGGAA